MQGAHGRPVTGGQPVIAGQPVIGAQLPRLGDTHTFWGRRFIKGPTGSQARQCTPVIPALGLRMDSKVTLETTPILYTLFEILLHQRF